MANGLRATVRSLEPQLPLDQVQRVERTVSDSEAPRRFNTALIAAFAFAAILLAALGIYGVIAFSAALRTQEMAIRIALGSQRSGILRLVFTSAAKLAVAGCAVGLLGAAAAFPPAALIPVWRQSVRPARSSAGRGLRTNVGLIGFLDCPLRCNSVRADWASRGSVTMGVPAIDYRLTTNH
jgi:ABC-type antimicrobial peptide transport system permease subunit